MRILDRLFSFESEERFQAEPISRIYEKFGMKMK